MYIKFTHVYKLKFIYFLFWITLLEGTENQLWLCFFVYNFLCAHIYFMLHECCSFSSCAHLRPVVEFFLSWKLAFRTASFKSVLFLIVSLSAPAFSIPLPISLNHVSLNFWLFIRSKVCLVIYSVIILLHLSTFQL